MAGFGEAKKAELKEEDDKVLAETPATKRMDSAPYAELRKELEILHEQGPKTHIFMGLIGHENTGKTAVILDAYQRYCDTWEVEA